MNLRATTITATGKNPAAGAAPFPTISPAHISAPAWLQKPAASGNKSGFGDLLAAPRINAVVVRSRITTNHTQESFTLKPPVYEGKQ